MKSTTLLLIGGLAFAGVALAGDPAPQSTQSSSASKIAIDPVTGQRRAITEEESAALDAQVAQTNARSRSIAQSIVSAGGLPIPATYEESIAGAVTKDGLTAYIAPLEAYSRVVITRAPDGKVTISEDDSGSTHSVEAARE